MTASPERGTPLAELLQALAPPLEYLATDDFRRLDQTRLPLDALAARLAHARAGSGGAAAAPLAELSEVFATLQHEPAETHGAALRRAHALLPALREAVGTTPAWADYRPAIGPVEPALAALAGSVEVVRAVGPKRTADLARFGLATVEDLLFHLPFRYEDRRALRPLAELRVGDEATAIGEVARAREGQVGRRGRRVLEVVLRDAGGVLLLVWFHQIPYFRRRLTPGQRLVVHGKVEPPLGGVQRQRCGRCRNDGGRRCSLLDGFKIGDCTQQLAAMAERRNTDLFEVLIRQVTQDREIDIVFGKALGVLGHAELFEPVHDLMHRDPHGYTGA